MNLSIDSSTSAFYSDDSTNFSWNFYIIFVFFLCNTKIFLPQGQVQDHIKRPPAENDRRPVRPLGNLVYFPKAPAFGKGFYPLPTLRGRPLLHLSEK